MNKEDRSAWALEDWKAYALERERAAAENLDGWGRAVAEMEAASQMRATLLHDYQDSSSLLERYAAFSDFLLEMLKAETEKPKANGTKRRRRGRPRTIEPRAVLTRYQAMAKAFQAEHGRNQNSVKEVLLWHNRKMLQESHSGQWRGQEALVNKALMNEIRHISNACTWARKELQKFDNLRIAVESKFHDCA